MEEMSSVRVTAALAVLCLTAGGLSSCVVKRRIITRIGAKGSQPVLLTAQAPELVRRIADQYNRIHDFNATVDMTPALGTAEKGRITEYKDVRGYILFRKPSEIRIIGLYPLVRNTAFDMVSDGMDFKLYVPSQNRFLVGSNTIRQPSKNKLENLRPQHFLDALLVKPVESTAKVLLENFTDEDNAFYILHVIHERNSGELVLSRTIWFNRVNLRLARQIVLDPGGNIVSDARYSDWREYDKVPFPRHVEVNRPIDEYGVVLDVQKMDINKGVSDDKFVLRQPQGSKLQQVGDTRGPVPDQSVQESNLK
jgi:outer membrane lipoprotein-sorting protein